MFANNTVTCAGAGLACLGGSVAIEGGNSSFIGDAFSGNIGLGGATSDLYVVSSTPDDGIELAGVTFNMTANTTSAPSAVEAHSPIGVVVPSSRSSSKGAVFSCPVGYEVATRSSVGQTAYLCERCTRSAYLVQNGTLDLDNAGRFPRGSTSATRRTGRRHAT